ncbi:hypothetical protein MMC19_004047 [Ptychographa xylographoides]|nr:hypothetical protein [Ptychographa xylographoides]
MVFNGRVLAARTLSEEVEASSSSQRMCNDCQEVYRNPKELRSHLRSKCHNVQPHISYPIFARSELETDKNEMISLTELDSTSKLETMGEVSDTPEPNHELFVSSECLFCDDDSFLTIEHNLDHMLKVHGMFVPDQENLFDVKGLLGFLHIAITDYHQCLYCDQTKSTTAGVQQHMKDKGHCKVNFEIDPDLRSFYKYPEDDLASDVDSEIRQDVFEDPDFERHLPSGRIVGHRSQARYYRQHLHSYPTFSERTEQRAIADTTSDLRNESPTNVRQIITRVDAGMIGVPEARRRALQVSGRNMVRQDIKVRNTYQRGLQRRNNHQEYFRVSDEKT